VGILRGAYNNTWSENVEPEIYRAIIVAEAD